MLRQPAPACNMHIKSDRPLCDVIQACVNITVHRRLNTVDTALVALTRFDRFTSCFSRSMDYDGYKSGARQRHLTFDLSESAFHDITTAPCVYCGLTAQQRGCFNGVDRVDSQRGYITGNVVTSCTRCNWMKNDQSVEEFLDQCVQIANRWSHLLVTEHPEDTLLASLAERKQHVDALLQQQRQKNTRAATVEDEEDASVSFHSSEEGVSDCDSTDEEVSFD